MNELRELYQEMILEHGRNPRNCCPLADANRQAEGFNRLCGDQLTVYLRIQQGIIEAVCFTGSGCAISMASASLMSEALKGKTEAEAQQLFSLFHTLVTTDEPSSTEPAFTKLAVFSGVKAYPARVKCATLAWHTLQAALAKKSDPVSTE
jgi:nitrogen fixation protein NifU and related proteins